ncbi:MAG: metal-dependent hydrolase [Gammaproteobacteria bacterium]|nr:metal-dependent hydrolase [Gammaproteobacteria bacterium]MBQ0774483.1 metal-dependent hydrolase [Gammaproteobacteria bacterium]
MFLAHLPAGYLLTRALTSRRPGLSTLPSYIMAAGLLGSIAPDLDLLWFYLVDNRAHPHHSYWTHFPSAWAMLLALSLLWVSVERQRHTAKALLVFACGGLLHLVLDSVAGGIRWLAPFSSESWSLTEVKRFVEPWWLNFFLHWSMLIEAIIVAIGWHQYSLDRQVLNQTVEPAKYGVISE